MRKHTSCRWVLLYVGRWLEAPVQLEDGRLLPREAGTPQGGAISPLLANLFLHYAFDLWMQRTHPDIPFERYADDVICHCRTEAHAGMLRRSVARRLAECRLELNDQKTRIVYCKSSLLRGTYPNQSFDFLGYTFRPRCARSARGNFVAFSPGVSRVAVKAMQRQVRRWRLHRRTDRTLVELARAINPIVRGWINYYARYCRSALYPFLNRLNRLLVRWTQWRYQRFNRCPRRATRWLARIARQHRSLLAHWQLLPPSAR